MIGADNDCELVIEQVLLHDILEYERIAQRAEQEIGRAATQLSHEIVVGAFEDRDCMQWVLVQELDEDTWQQKAAGERHGTDDRAPTRAPADASELRARLVDLGERELGAARET